MSLFVRLLSAHCNFNGKIRQFRFSCSFLQVTVSLIDSSSYYCPSVANAPDVLQPYWLIVLPLDVPDLTASLLLWGSSGQRWRCLWTFLFSNVPTFATSRLREILAAKGVTTWARNGRWILPEYTRLPRNIQGSFTCRMRHGTDDFTSPPKGGVLRIFFALKNPTTSVGFEPANLGTKGQHATSRLPTFTRYNVWGKGKVVPCSRHEGVWGK